MENIVIDKKKNPDITDVVATMQPGDAVDLHCSIKANDDQTLTLTVREASEGKPFDEEDDDEKKTEEGDQTTPPPAQTDSGPGDMGLTGGESAGT